MVASASASLTGVNKPPSGAEPRPSDVTSREPSRDLFIPIASTVFPNSQNHLSRLRKAQAGEARRSAGLATLLLQHLRNVVLGDEIEAGVNNLRHLLALLDGEQRVHRLLAHLERTLTNQRIGIAIAQQLELHLQRIGHDKRELAGIDILLVSGREGLKASGGERRPAADGNDRGEVGR